MASVHHLDLKLFTRLIVETRAALLNYRRAFKIDPGVEREYHRSASTHTGWVSKTQRQSVDYVAFQFARTVQLGPDYCPPDESNAQNHPSSTKRLFASLVRSFVANPWPFPEPGTEKEGSPIPKPSISSSWVDPDQVPSHLTFHAEDPTQPVPFNKLPLEIIFEILIRLSIRDRDEGGTVDIMTLERSWARVSRYARILSLDSTLWKELCTRIYVPPTQIPPYTSPFELVQLHGWDWRRMVIERPRLRLDGAFISVCQYVRVGQAETAWSNPSHVVTFYRMLRFLPTGQVVSLLTTTSPEHVVRKLGISLQMKGLSIGYWHLREDKLEAWDLEETLALRNPAGLPKYRFRMAGRLSSTQRGRMDKLKLDGIWTVNTGNGEEIEIPRRHEHERPFYFSRVRHWVVEEESDLKH